MHMDLPEDMPLCRKIQCEEHFYKCILWRKRIAFFDIIDYNLLKTQKKGFAIYE